MFLINKNKIYTIVAAFAFVISCLYLYSLNSRVPTGNFYKVQVLENLKTQTVQIGGANIQAELATTEAERIQGLSSRSSLVSSTGMFFVFDYPSNWGIWMKDMRFPIDVLWVTGDLKVNYIVENMLPASYPKVYSSLEPTLYVLEVPAGTVKNYGIVVGQDVLLK